MFDRVVETLYNLKNVKNTHREVLILVMLQASTCNLTKINTPLWVFFTFFKLYKWYQIAQHITYFADLSELITYYSPWSHKETKPWVFLAQY